MIEIKAVKKYEDMEEGCQRALKQMADQKYDQGLREEGYQNILEYAVCFYRKECLIKKQEA